jgi:hypothetical protein
LLSVRHLVAVGVVSLLGMWAREVRAVGVPAGTSINNTAQVNYTVGSLSATATSNTSTVTVAEILDVVVTLQTRACRSIAGATQQELLYRVTKHRQRSGDLPPADDQRHFRRRFDPVPAAPSIYFDTDASGDLSPGDTPYVAGSNDPVLNADAFVTILVVNDIPAGVADGNRGFSRLLADARTGVGSPGTLCRQGQRVPTRWLAPPAPRRSHGEYSSPHRAQCREVAVGCRPIRRHTAGSGRAHQLHHRRERHWFRYRWCLGIHRRHSRQHHLRARHAAPQQRGALRWRGCRRGRFFNDTECTRECAARFAQPGEWIPDGPVRRNHQLTGEDVKETHMNSRKHNLYAIVALITCGFTTQAFAQAKACIELKTTAAVEKEVVNDKGEKSKVLVPAGKVIPAPKWCGP